MRYIARRQLIGRCNSLFLWMVQCCDEQYGHCDNGLFALFDKCYPSKRRFQTFIDGAVCHRWDI